MASSKLTVVVLVLSILAGCEGTEICYAHSAGEIEERIDSRDCEAVFVYDVSERTLRFKNNNPAVSVFINDIDNPAVRRVEADGLGIVNTSLIEEVVRTNTSCRGSTARARLLDFTIGDDGEGGLGSCVFHPDADSIVRLVAEPGVTVGSIIAQTTWSDVELEVDETAFPTETLYTYEAPIDVLQNFGTRMNDVHLNVMEDDILNAYFAWLDSEGYDGTVHVNSDDGQQTPVQVYPAVSE